MFTIKNIASCAGSICAGSLFLINSAAAAIPVQHWTQPSGAQVFLVASPAIPMLDVQLDFDAGSRRDPAAQAGLASMTANMATQGVRAVGKDPALDDNAVGEAWADLGASLGSSASADRMSFSLRSLTYPDLLDKATALAARQIGEPAFSDSLWQRERQRVAAQLKEAATRPGTVAGRALAAAVYGSHPYGYQLTEATLTRIQTTDMRAFYARSILPCRATVSLVGAVDRAQADALVTRLLARLPQTACAPLPTLPEVAPLAQASDQRIPFDSAQAQVMIGQRGYPRSDPDFFALLVGNHILGGGGFGSRLTSEVREKRGLSYSVYSGFGPGLHAGAFTIGLQTRPDQAAQAVQVAKQVLARFVAEGPTAAELQAAKDNLAGGFALRIDSNRKLLDNVANIAWNHLPLDYLDHWTQQIERVTQADIQLAFQRILQPEKMATVVVGENP
ncbi:zinc protease [Rhodoferax sp. OV413]|uniref:M16 family metallopeptidase n=1 Tax=Rhodoferax sp. OV413 TaxID=1855285 RepID=UPI00088C4396|nr:pitrilysin family protein [Rhodoferax sp. OV413]SDP23745.1 zinc protease [Rhodoferax sp. OV413]